MISEEEKREIMREDAIRAEIRQVMKEEAELELAVEMGIASLEQMREYYGNMTQEASEEYCVPRFLCGR